jgi:hypothetical protein
MSVRDLLRRGTALLLASLFLAGELGWSGVDALAFHTDVHHAAHPSLAASGAGGSGALAVLTSRTTSGDHAAHCVLGLTTGSARASGPAALHMRPEPAIALAALPASCVPGLRTEPGTLARPRAPPVRTA